MPADFQRNKPEILEKRRRHELAEGHRLPDMLDEVLAPDFVAHDLPPGLPPAREGLKAFRRIVDKTFPDLKPTIRDLIAEDDKVAARVALEGNASGRVHGLLRGHYLRFAERRPFRHDRLTPLE